MPFERLTYVQGKLQTAMPVESGYEEEGVKVGIDPESDARILIVEDDDHISLEESPTHPWQSSFYQDSVDDNRLQKTENDPITGAEVVVLFVWKPSVGVGSTGQSL